MTQRVRARSWFATAITGALAASAIVFAPGLAAAADEPRTFALVGSLQSELGCTDLGAGAGGDWEPACAETELVATGTPGVYAAEFTIPAGSYEYKVAVNDGWAESYGLNGGGDNIPLTVAGDTPVRVVFDDTLKRVGLEATGLRGAYDAASDAGLVADPVRQPGSDEVFYFVMTDRFQNGDAVERPGRPDGRRPHHRVRPRPQGLLQRRRPRRPALAARLHRRPRHHGHLADPELQEPPGAGRGCERQCRVPRLLGHRLHPDRSPPRHERRARGAHPGRARPRHQGLLRHHHEPHRRRHRLRGGPARVHRPGHRSVSRRRRQRVRPGRLRRSRRRPVPRTRPVPTPPCASCSTTTSSASASRRPASAARTRRHPTPPSWPTPCASPAATRCSTS